MSYSIPHQKIKAALQEFISDRSRWDMGICGTRAVYRLESRFASLVGHPHTLAVANATLGLWAVFMALGVRDAEVITTPYSWGGTLAGLIFAGNRPIFADIDAGSLTLDPEQVVLRITRNTKAILSVDIYGYPSNGPALREVANKHGLALIQDCAQSFGAYLGNHHTGWWADAAVFSFTWGKALFSGEGSVIVTPHRKLLERLIWETQHPNRQLRDVPHLPKNELGLNLRINPLAAVWADAVFDDALIGVEQHRKECVEILALLQREGISKTKFPYEKDVKPSFHVLTFEPCCEAARIEKMLRKRNLRCRISAPPVTAPLYCHDVYGQLAESHDWRKSHRCPVAEEESRRRVRLVKEKGRKG